MRRLKAGWLITLFAVLSADSAFSSTIGPPVVQRALVDTVAGIADVYQGVFPTVGETVVSFQFFNNQTSDTNWLTPLVLSFQSGRVWQITGIGTSVQNTGAGLQTYAFGLQSGSALIAASSYTFGWWDGRLSGGVGTANKGVIMFDAATSNPGFGESCLTPNSHCTITPTLGNFTFANDYSGPSSGSLVSGNGRVYSVEFTSAAIPEPSTLSFAVLGLLAVAASSRRLALRGR